MNRVNISAILLLHLSLLCCLLLNGCAGKTTARNVSQNTSPRYVISNSDDKKLVSINSLLVVPVFVNSSVSPNVPSNIDLNAMLSKALTEELQLKVVHSTRAAGGRKTVEVSEYADIAQANAVNTEYFNDAVKMNLDGVLVTKINNLESRVGSEVGSTEQARVDMAMQIYNSRTRQVVWQSTYHFKDAALTDNLFKIKDRLAENKPKFRSAQELLTEGYRNSIRDFSQKRLSGFVK